MTTIFIYGHQDALFANLKNFISDTTQVKVIGNRIIADNVQIFFGYWPEGLRFDYFYVPKQYNHSGLLIRELYTHATTPYSKLNTLDELYRTIYLNITKKLRDDRLDSIRYGYIDMNGVLPSSRIEKVIFNDPATIVFWMDGTKTVVKCCEGDVFDKEKGLAMAIVKKRYGNNNSFHKIFQKWCPEEKVVAKTEIANCDLSLNKTICNFNEIFRKLRPEKK